MKTLRFNSVFMIRLAGCPIHFYLLTMNKMDTISVDFYFLKDMYIVHCTVCILYNVHQILSTMNAVGACCISTENTSTGFKKKYVQIRLNIRSELSHLCRLS
jgi:hypothetical protein